MDQPEDPDTRLLRRATSGDPTAFGELAGRHTPHLLRVAFWMVHNRADAEDVVQETLLQAYRGMRGFRGASTVKTWLTRILTRQAARSWRRTKRERAARRSRCERQPTTNADRTTGDAIAAVESRVDAAEVMSRLTAAHRQVLALHEIQGMSSAEIARVLSVPRGTVESRLTRARAELRRALRR